MTDSERTVARMLCAANERGRFEAEAVADALGLIYEQTETVIARRMESHWKGWLSCARAAINMTTLKETKP